MALLSFEPSSIFVLLRHCGPAAISWLVITIIIYSIKEEFWTWPSPHIFQKVSKVQPSLANPNATPSPMLVFRVIRISASLNHARPCVIFVTCFTSLVFSMLKVLFHFNASAALCGLAAVFINQMISENHFSITAITNTKPSRAALANLGISRDNQKSVKLMPHSINQGSSHAWIIPFAAMRGELQFQRSL